MNIGGLLVRTYVGVLVRTYVGVLNPGKSCAFIEPSRTIILFSGDGEYGYEQGNIYKSRRFI